MGDETRFVGRQAELATLTDWLDEGRRLITVLGPPGTGKTRTLREFGLRMSTADLVDRVIWCELASTRSREGVLAAVAAAANVTPRAGDAFGESVIQVGASLAESGPTLVLLDNFEQVSDFAPETVGEWFARCPEVHFLVSSRHRLDLPGEYVFDLEPLTTPDAVELFVDRARMVRRNFDPDDHGHAIERLVVQLDRLPLAIELAGARAATLSPADMLARLDSRFRLLRSRKRNVAERQATMEGAIEWSWELLDDDERAALAQCSLFRGGFSADAAEAVIEVDDAWAIDLLETLRARSLVRSEDVDGNVRFSLYESIRDFAAARLDEVTDREAATKRHATHFARVGTESASEMHGPGGHDAMRKLERETPNMMAAFDRTREHSPEVALSVAASLDDLLRFVGPSDMHENLLDRAISTARDSDSRAFPPARFLRARAELNALSGDLDASLADIEEALETAGDAERARLLLRLGENLRTRGQASEGAERLGEAIEVGETTGGSRLVRTALGHQASCFVDMGDLEGARQCLERLRDIDRSDDLRQECELLKRIAYVQYYLGNYDEQRRQNDEALELAREIGDRRLEGLCLQGVGDSAFAQGDYDEAVDYYQRGLEIHRALGNLHFEAMLLGNLGGAYHRGGNLGQARKCYARSLELHRRTGARPYEGVVSFALGALEHESGNADDAHFHYDRAIGVAQQTGQKSDEAALLLCKTWVDLESESFAGETLRARVDEAREIFASEDDAWEPVATGTLGLIDLLAGDRDGARRRLTDAVQCVGDEQAAAAAIVRAFEFLLDLSAPEHADPRAAIATFAQDDVYRRSLHARLAARLIRSVWRNAVSETTGEEYSEASELPAVIIGEDVKWFEFPGAERVDLRRRKALRLVLSHLLDMHTEEPGRGIDVHEMFDQGWPGEEIHPDQATERVYWAVRTLRKLGFENILLTSDEGYHLVSDLVVSRAE